MYVEETLTAGPGPGGRTLTAENQDETASSRRLDVVDGGLVPDAQTFTLHSKPGSQRTIYLDFDGAVLPSTAWG
jgi:hypothetical protein